jgi:hypothetical protein
MSTLEQKLQGYFSTDELEWRVARAGVTDKGPWAQLLVYLTSRAVMNRLDEVFGAGGWTNNIAYGPGGQVLCTIGAKIDGEWVYKTDGADETDIEAVKGGISGAMKRAGVQWGIGRYLYEFGNTYAIISDKGKHRGQYKDKAGKTVSFKYDIPDVPPQFLPGNEPWMQQPKERSKAVEAPANDDSEVPGPRRARRT